MWNLTEIWKTLKLPRGKAPSEWKTKEAKRFASTPVKLRSERVGSTPGTWATEEAAIAYAMWVSDDCKSFATEQTFPTVLITPTGGGLPLRGGLSRSVGCDFRVQTKGVHVNVST
ncbi:KilA-N domain-containing protein [Escherichia coli]|uniref:KilA-N domain-containing protein n=1 Tax=Escherichia coli TaxID=562 RepID=UPI0038F69ED6